jgi:hypothetical protein
LGRNAGPHRPRPQNGHLADVAHDLPPAACRSEEKPIIANAPKTVKLGGTRRQDNLNVVTGWRRASAAPP